SIRIHNNAKTLKKIKVPTVESKSEAHLELKESKAAENLSASLTPVNANPVAQNLQKLSLQRPDEELEPEEAPPLPPASFKLFLPELNDSAPNLPLRRKKGKHEIGTIIGSYLNVNDESNKSRLKFRGYLRDENYQETVANIIIDKLIKKDVNDEIYKFIQSKYPFVIGMLDDYLLKLQNVGEVI